MQERLKELEKQFTDLNAQIVEWNKQLLIIQGQYKEVKEMMDKEEDKKKEKKKK